MAAKQDTGTVEIPLDEVLPASGDEPQQTGPMVVKTIVTQGKGQKQTARVVSNREAIDAIASLGGSGSSIWVERIEPVKHGGRRVQTGKLISLALTADDLTKNLPATLAMLGRRGRLFKIGAGDKSAPLEVAGGALDLLDYEDEGAQQTVVGMDSYGRPVVAQVSAPSAPPLQMQFQPFQPNHPLSASDIAKAVAEAVGAGKKSEAYELKILEMEQRRQEREERAEKERRDREEKLDKERKEKEEREARERRERDEREERRRTEREKEEKDERNRREEKEKAERKEKEERDSRDRKEREERETRDRIDREKNQERQYNLMLQASKDQNALVQQLLVGQANKDEGFLDKWIKLRALEPKDDPLKNYERIASIIGGNGAPEGIAETIIKTLPDLVRAGTEWKMAPPGVPMIPAGYQPAQVAAQQQTGQAAPAQVAHKGPTMDLPELLDGLKSVTEAIEKKYSPADAIRAFRRERSQGGVPNFCAVCAAQTPEALAEELKKLYLSDKLPEEQKAAILAFQPVATSEVGKAWLTQFFAEVRKA